MELSDVFVLGAASDIRTKWKQGLQQQSRWLKPSLEAQHRRAVTPCSKHQHYVAVSTENQKANVNGRWTMTLAMASSIFIYIYCKIKHSKSGEFSFLQKKKKKKGGDWLQVIKNFK